MTHPRAIHFAWLDGEQVVECPNCHAHLQVPRRIHRRQRAARAQALVPQKTIRFHDPEDRELALRLEDRRRLERVTMSRLVCRLLRQGWTADPHLDVPGGTP